MTQPITILMNVFDKSLIVAGVVFPLTTAYMLLVIRLNGENPILLFCRSKLSVDFDLRLFGYLRIRYTEMKGDRVIPLVNRLSWYIAIGGLLLYYALAVLESLV